MLDEQKYHAISQQGWAWVLAIWQLQRIVCLKNSHFHCKRNNNDYMIVIATVTIWCVFHCKRVIYLRFLIFDCWLVPLADRMTFCANFQASWNALRPTLNSLHFSVSFLRRIIFILDVNLSVIVDIFHSLANGSICKMSHSVDSSWKYLANTLYSPYLLLHPKICRQFHFSFHFILFHFIRSVAFAGPFSIWHQVQKNK